MSNHDNLTSKLYNWAQKHEEEVLRRAEHEQREQEFRAFIENSMSDELHRIFSDYSHEVFIGSKDNFTIYCFLYNNWSASNNVR